MAAAASRSWWRCRNPRELQGKRVLRHLTTGLRGRSRLLLATGSAVSDRHQPAPQVSARADIQRGNAVAAERRSGVSDALSVRTCPASEMETQKAISQREPRFPFQRAGQKQTS